MNEIERSHSRLHSSRKECLFVVPGLARITTNHDRLQTVTTRLVVGLDQDTHAATDGSTSEEGWNEKACHSWRKFLQKAPDEHWYVGYTMVCRPAGQGTPKVRMVLATGAQRTRFTHNGRIHTVKADWLESIAVFLKTRFGQSGSQSCDLRTGLPKALQQAN